MVMVMANSLLFNSTPNCSSHKKSITTTSTQQVSELNQAALAAISKISELLSVAAK